MPALLTKAAHSFYDCNASAYGAFAIVLMGARIPEINQRSVPHELCDEAVKIDNCTRNDVLKRADNITHVLGVQLRR